MSGEAPSFLERRLAEPGGLAGDLLGGATKARELLPDSTLVTGEGSFRADHRGEVAAPSDGPGLEAEVFGVTDESCREKLSRILAGEGSLVTTGQQPVLFLGPLYVLYKALTAVEVARRIEAETGRPALACFWVASDDHDWDEVGSVTLLDLENELRTVRLPPPEGRADRSVGETPTPGNISEQIDELSEHLPTSDFIDVYLECVRDAYEPGRSLGRAFGRLLGRLLHPAPLAWLDAAAPEVRERGRALFRRILAEADGVEEALADGERRVREAGYEPQLRHEPGGAPLFLDRGEGRTRLYHEGDRVRLGRGDEVVPREEILSDLDGEPARFSPNVALRPVLESWLLPVAASVVGPAELAYWSQLPELFRWADCPFPRLHPRLSWTVVEEKVEKVLRKLDASPEELTDGGEELIRRVTAAGRPEGVEEALSEARRQAGETFERIEAAVSRELPGIRSAVGAARHEAFEVLEELERRVDARVRERQEILHDQIRKAARHVYPAGIPQERVLSPLYYLSRYGASFLDALREATRERVEERPEGAAAG